MNKEIIKPLIEKSLAKQITFPEILEILTKENVESYHVDLLRNECRFYSRQGESMITSIAFNHGEVAAEFSVEKLDAINRRVQAKQATFSDFIEEAAIAGCAYYIVYLKGKKVRYFGRNDGEHIQYFPTPSSGSHKETATVTVARSAIKSIDIRASFEKVFSFISNPLNWPQYAIINMKSVSPGADGWFNTVTKFGLGQIKMNAIRELGIFDHVWKDSQASWVVPARVVSNKNGVTVMMTIFQPPVMSDQQFDEAMKEMNQEMNQLKELLEKSN